MEANAQQNEYLALLDGPAPFLDVVFETIDAHIDRTRNEYAEIVTGVDAMEAGDVDHDEKAALYLYVLGDVDPEEARELIGLALDRIADEHDMVLGRQGVQITFPEEGSRSTEHGRRQ